MTRALVFETHYPVRPERVWQAITDARELSTWLMPTDFAPVVGRTYTMRTRPGPSFNGVVTGEVLEVEPPTRLAYTWNGGPVRNTRVIWTLTAQGSGTDMRLEHLGFNGVRSTLVAALLGNGWRGLVLRDLPRHLTAVSVETWAA